MFKKVTLAALIALLSSAAFAADGESYGGIDFGRTTVRHYDGHESGNGVYLGLMMTPVFGLEAGYHRLAKFDLSTPGNPGSFVVDQMALSVIGNYPLAYNFSVFGRLGYNQIKGAVTLSGKSTTDTENKALYGFGVTYAITPTILARVEAQRPNSDTTTINTGIMFKF